jgi:hypothetical protein
MHPIKITFSICHLILLIPVIISTISYCCFVDTMACSLRHGMPQMVWQIATRFLLESGHELAEQLRGLLSRGDAEDHLTTILYYYIVFSAHYYNYYHQPCSYYHYTTYTTPLQEYAALIKRSEV